MEMPAAGSTYPAATGSRCLILTCASKIVAAASCVLMGPTFPETRTLPSPGSEALTVKGKASLREKCSNLDIEMVVDLGISLQRQRFYPGVAVFDGDEADGEIG